MPDNFYPLVLAPSCLVYLENIFLDFFKKIISKKILPRNTKQLGAKPSE